MALIKGADGKRGWREYTKVAMINVLDDLGSKFLCSVDGEG